MNVLLSVKPKYVQAILSGQKKYEFRRILFKRKDIQKVYIYCNSTVKKIVAAFEVGEILDGTPEEIWKACEGLGGIDERDFFRYFEGRQRAYAIRIADLKKFEDPIDPFALIENFRPPQSFYYVADIENC
jgi:type I restriction enzyme, S subunit